MKKQLFIVAILGTFTIFYNSEAVKKNKNKKHVNSATKRTRIDNYENWALEEYEKILKLCKNNKEEAIETIKNVIEYEEIKEIKNLAKLHWTFMLFYGIGIKKNIPECLRYCNRMAKESNPDAIKFMIEKLMPRATQILMSNKEKRKVEITTKKNLKPELDPETRMMIYG